MHYLNNFTKSTPASWAAIISFIVIIPGKYGTLYLLHIFAVSKSKAGDTMYFAPANIAALAVSASKTVPAPITTSSWPSYISLNSFIISLVNLFV